MSAFRCATYYLCLFTEMDLTSESCHFLRNFKFHRNIHTSKKKHIYDQRKTLKHS